MREREEIVLEALREGANKSQLAKGAGISRKTLYKWCRRYSADGKEALLDLSLVGRITHPTQPLKR